MTVRAGENSVESPAAAVNSTPTRGDAPLVDADDGQLGVAQDARAVRHRQRALQALHDDDCAHVALTEALLALEARVEELVCYVAQLA